MASAKGGSGKTVLTATLGTFLVALGKKVLLLDADAATNGLTLLYLKEARFQSDYAYSKGHAPLGVYEALSRESRPEIVQLKSGVHFIPATYSFINTERVDADHYGKELGKLLFALREEYDFIFLDAQAGSDVYAEIAMRRDISDEVVIVSEYDPMSAAGVERLKGLFRETLTTDRTWVLLNKMLPEFVQSFSDFLEVAKYVSPIPWDADVVRAYARRKLALDLENGNEHTLAVIQTLKSLLGESISTEIDVWTNGRAASIRQPIEDQYADTERQLDALMEEKWASIDESRRRTFTNILSLVGLTGAFLAILFWLFQWVLLPRPGLLGFFLISQPVWLLVLALLISVLLALLLNRLIFRRDRRTSDSERFLQESRISRQIEILNEKLGKLEALRAADLETLIRKNKR